MKTTLDRVEFELDKIRIDMLKNKEYYILPESKRDYPEFEDINNGYCYMFAERAIEVLSLATTAIYHEIEYKGVPHAFVEYCGRFYDAECIQGVKNYLDLPLFLSLGKPKSIIEKIELFVQKIEIFLNVK